MNRSINSVTLFGILTLFAAGCSQKVNFGQAPSLNQSKSSCTETSCTSVPQNISESFDAPKAAYKADIMLVMDTTPTMFSTITQMANHFGTFVSSLGNVDWQVGIVNASVSSYDVRFGNFTAGQLLNLNTYPSELGSVNHLVPGNDWNQDILNHNLDFYGLTWPVQAGEPSFCDQQPYCSTSSTPLEAISAAMTNPSNAGFFRKGSFFVPVIISAQDENAGASGTAQPQDVINGYQKNLASTAAGMRAYSIIVKPGDSACLDQYSSIFKLGDGGKYGASFDQLAKQTGGQSISICQNDFGQALANQLTGGFAPQVTSITLKQTPIDGTVKIVATPAVDFSYTVNGNVVTFGQALPAGTHLSVSYQVNN